MSILTLIRKHPFIVLAAVALYLALLLVPLFALLTIGTVGWVGPDGKVVNIPQRDTWETLYFMSNTLLFFVATSALFFAFRQSTAAIGQNETALRSTQAQVYIAIEEKFSSHELIESRKKFVSLRNELQSEDAPGSIGVRADKKLCELLDDRVRDYVTHIRLLIFIESIGLMARRNYVLLDDIYYLLESVILECDQIFRDHIMTRRKRFADAGASNSDRLFEHTIWLIERIRNYQPVVPLSE